MVSNVRSASPDLSSRQFALLLTVYLTEPPHTVRGLAQVLNISKPAISRALDRLGRLGLIRRKRDDADRRNVLVQRTAKGSMFLEEFAALVTESGKSLEAARRHSPESRLKPAETEKPMLVLADEPALGSAN